jgi:hypothetical protein
MATKQVTIDEATYTIAPLTFSQAEEIFSEGANSKQLGRALVAASLNNADGGSRTHEDIGKMSFPEVVAIRDAALQLNGLAGSTVGEAKAAATA